MAVVLNTNVSSFMVQRNLFNSTQEVRGTMTKLSSGLRINSAADDAAGLSLSEKLKSGISASDYTKLNAKTGSNLLEIVEGDLGTIQENLQKMRELAVQSANGVYSSSERKMINDEFLSRMQEIDRVSKSSKFSDLRLLDGTLGPMTLQVGGDASNQSQIDISVAFSKVTLTSLGIVGANKLENATVSQVTSSRIALTILDKALEDISSKRSIVGSTANRLTSTISRMDITKENLSQSNSIIRDSDMAAETANLTRSQILQQTTSILLKQANQGAIIALDLL